MCLWWNTTVHGKIVMKMYQLQGIRIHISRANCVKAGIGTEMLIANAISTTAEETVIDTPALR